MPYDIEDHIQIDVSPARLWPWLVEDVGREQQWRNIDGSGVQTLERVDDGPAQIGSRFRGTVKVGPGKPQAYVNEITAYEREKRVAWETVDAEGPLGGRGVYEVTPTNGGVRFDIRLEYPPRTFMGHVQRPLVRMIGRRFVSQMLQKLKRLVEEEEASAGRA